MRPLGSEAHAPLTFTFQVFCGATDMLSQKRKEATEFCFQKNARKWRGNCLCDASTSAMDQRRKHDPVQT